MTEPKVHLIVRNYALCNSVIRGPGRLAVRSVSEFHALDGAAEQCKKCAETVARLEATGKRSA